MVLSHFMFCQSVWSCFNKTVIILKINNDMANKNRKIYTNIHDFQQGNLYPYQLTLSRQCSAESPQNSKCGLSLKDQPYNFSINFWFLILPYDNFITVISSRLVRYVMYFFWPKTISLLVKRIYWVVHHNRLFFKYVQQNLVYTLLSVISNGNVFFYIKTKA